MNKPTARRYTPLELLVSLLVLGFLFVYTYGILVGSPFLGFNFSTPSGEIVDIFVFPVAGERLQPGDRILVVGPVRWQDYIQRKVDLPFTAYRAGDALPLMIERAGETIAISWILPGFNALEIRSRLLTLPWIVLPYIFWLIGCLVLFIIRPRDARRNLLVAFNFITAIWLITGALSGTQVYQSSRIFHIALWVSVPITWQLNWEIARPQKIIPRWVWGLLYTTAAVFAALDVFRIIPGNPYRIPLMLMTVGSIIILTLHWATNPRHRKPLLIILVGFVIGVLPGLVRILTDAEIFNIAWVNALSLWSLCLLPITYVYAMFYRQLGGLELRASHAVSMLSYGILIFSAAYLVVLFFSVVSQQIIIPITSLILVTLIVAVFSAISYPTFRRWFEHRLMGIPIAPQKILAHYSDQIMTVLDQVQLIELLRDQILPSLLIRQAAFIWVYPPGHGAQTLAIKSVLMLNIVPTQLPGADELPVLMKLAGHQIGPSDEPLQPGLGWIKLSLFKQTSEMDRFLMCLFGRRDPEDYYAATEIPTLQAIVNNTALALINIEQTGLLHLLYQLDIERNERERSRLALDLHDDVLNQLALLAQSMDEAPTSDEFIAAYQASVQRVREIISGLRPPLLDYGLAAALKGLIDDVANQAPLETNIETHIPASSARYPPDVELHLYRIVQQACQNAVKHSHASQITIKGDLTSAAVTLIVEDNGIGMESAQALNLESLLASRRFGLASMVERASLIGAHLSLRSAPGEGLYVQTTWQAAAQSNPPPGAA